MEIIMIIAVILGPIAAVYIGQKLVAESEKRKEKMFVLKTLLICRNNKLNFGYVEAINSIDVIFIDNKDVRAACRKLIKIYAEQKEGSDEEKKCLIELIEKITEDLGYKNKITWQNLQNPYIPTGMVEAEQLQREVQNGQLALAKIAESFIYKTDQTKEG